MGKGSRNRQLHLQERMDHPEKYRKKKQAPKWLAPLISLVLVAAILVGAIAYIITSNGIIKRGRVILESQTGKFDINQQMATFIAWQELYYSAYTYWYYCSYGLYEDTDNITKTYTADQYALTVAQVSVSMQLRDCVDDIMDSLKIYVAVCDEAYRNNVSLDSEDMTEITESIDELKSMQTSYGYGSFNAFLSAAMGSGMKESDIKSALKLITLYNKYTQKMQGDFEKAVVLSDLEKYRNDNPEDFFKIDYLTFAADNKELAEQLKACKTTEEFKALVLENHLAENYKTAYNKYTTNVKATDELATLSGKTDANNDTALSTALDAIGADAAKDFLATDDYTGKEELKNWLFNTSRKQFETTAVSTETGIYVVAFLSAEASTEKVNARVKFYEFVEGETHEEDANFKKNILEYINQSKQEEPVYPKVDYKTASDKADAFKTKLENATDAERLQLLNENNATVKSGITSDTTESSTLPEEVIDAVTASDVKVGDILTANNGSEYYVIYVSAYENEEFSVSFVTIKGDLYYQIIDDLTTSLNKVYPEEKVGTYSAEPEEGTFEAWLSALSNKETFTSERKEGDTNYFEVTKDEVTTYNVYMVVNTPMYLETELVVKGGYLEFDEETFAEDAQAALETLKDKTDLDLLNALYAMDSHATVSSTIKHSSVKETDAKLAEWLFSDDRKANDIAVVTAEDGKSAYVVIFSEKMETWQSNAKSAYVSEKLEKWANDLAAAYTPNEKILNKLGEPSTTAETTTAAAE